MVSNCLSLRSLLPPPVLSITISSHLQFRRAARNSPQEMCQENENDSSARSEQMFHQDCQPPPCPVVMKGLPSNVQIESTVSEIGVKKKKRAATEHVASIALTDLAKYFDLPITEASRNLKVGLTVLKRKCREFGIPRWPHRKIKSLDTLIHDLREEAERQERENKAAAMAVMKRQRMLECERECIEQRPSMEIQSETKRFRQDIFKRRHRARLLKNSIHKSAAATKLRSND